MMINKGKQGCQNCINREKNDRYGIICKYKARAENAKKEFYTPNEITECRYYKYDEKSVIDR